MKTTTIALAAILLFGGTEAARSERPPDAHPTHIHAAKADAAQAGRAARLLGRYLAAPWAGGDARVWPEYENSKDEAKAARLAILEELASIPAAAVPVVEPVILGKATSLQRLELARMLLNVQTRPCAELLHRVAQGVREPGGGNDARCEEVVRQTAVMGLAKMARRTERKGNQRIPQGPEFPAKVPGLVPYLIAATQDKAVRVRRSAVTGLADCRDLKAVPALRACLKDTDPDLRRYAACYLTEYQDASGIPEMLAALGRLKNAKIGSEHYALEMLFASLERITGKGFGEIPELDCVWEASEIKRYRELYDAWVAWWNWHPVPNRE